MVDVVIIGAGPAGTAAGLDLARAGFTVAIWDRRPFPRKKACAGGITPKAMAVFAHDISHLVHRSCDIVQITRPCGSRFQVRSHSPLCYTTQRQDLDHYCLNQAARAGARFDIVDRILDMEIQADQVTLRVEANGQQRTETARYVIGADGANSRVARLLAHKGSGKAAKQAIAIRKFPALEADVRVDCPGQVFMEFDFSQGINGYYWLFPKRDHVNIGIYSTGTSTPLNRKLLADYAQKRLGSNRIEAVKGFPIPTRAGSLFSRPFCGSGRVLLAGDAAGLAEPLLGEGIYYALKSGRLAARAVHLALAQRSANALNMYSASLTRINLDLACHRAAQSALYRFPRFCLSLGRSALVHGPFARGYAGARSVFHTLFPF